MKDANADAGRVVLITGAGKGIGRAVAEHLGRSGARVLVNNRRRSGEDSAAQTVEAIRAAGGDAIANQHDIRDEGAAEAMVSAALDAWGRIDAVVFNAGVSGPAARVSKQSEAAFRDVMELNFFANLAILQSCIPHICVSPAGRLVFVASSAGLYGVHGRAPYAASKGALIGMALSLAQELKRDRIGVNVFAPYATTQMTRDAARIDEEMEKRMAPERVAPVGAWLCSSACDSTGEIWVAGGGALRRARVMEGGGAHLPATDAVRWLAEHASELREMPDPKGYPNAEAAYADFVARF
ncbi:MAG TPA: SDR family NAD(P)-dependent oxidoreductase [Caulobacterales bacterium]|nr:SDR family NAD(P)-dependent oxidoreductase [Caulobacterales bacterium]